MRRRPDHVRVENQTFQIVAGGKFFGSVVYRPFLVQHNSSWLVENKGMLNKPNLKK